MPYEAAISGGVLLVFGLIVKFQQGRIGKLDEKKVDKEHFGTVIKGFEESLKRGEKRFDKIERVMDKNSETLTDLSQTLALQGQHLEFIAKKNGYKD